MNTSKIRCNYLPSSPFKNTHFLLCEWKELKVLYYEHYTKVILYQHIASKEIGALKLYLKNKMTQKELDRKEKDFSREVKVHYLMDGISSIVPLWFWYENYNSWGLMTKFMNQIYLLKKLYSFTTEKQIIHNVVYPLLKALYYLHSLNIIHRDIKPENIFMHNSKIYIGDFGYSYLLSNEDPYSTSLAGTLSYMAPELIMHYLDHSIPLKYRYEVDIWAIGIIIYEMLYHIKPFGWSTYKNYVKEDPSKPSFIASCIKTPLTFPDTNDISNEAKDFIKKCLYKNPNERFTCEQLLEHVWILNYLKDTIDITLLKPCPSETLIMVRKSQFQQPQVKILPKQRISCWKSQCIM